MVGRERLHAAVHGRIIAYTERGDAAPVLADDALIEADQLWREVQPDSGAVPPLDVLHTVAWLHWCRCLALPAEERDTDFEKAVDLFTLVAAIDKSLVPERLRAFTYESTEAGDDGDAWDAWGTQALELLERLHHVDDPAALNRAIDLLHRTLAAIPADHPDRAGYLSELGGALQSRFEHSGDLADIDEAIAAGRKAVAARPIYPHDWLASLSNLGYELRVRFDRTGDLADLDEAIALGREATAATLADYPFRASVLSTLSATLLTRFERSGELADLDEAIALGRDAVAATPAEHPKRAGRLSNLGSALRNRFEHGRQRADLDEAIAVGREAIVGTPAGQPGRATYLSNLGNVLQARFEDGGQHSDIDEAVTLGRDAVTATPANHPHRAGRLSNLGSALRIRFERGEHRADIEEAVAAGRDAVTATPADHPDRAGRLHNFGLALRIRFERGGQQADIDEAVSAWKEAAAASTAPASSRLSAAAEWGKAMAALGLWSAALDGYATAVELLALLAWRGTARASQEHMLADWIGLAAAAAACAVAAGQPEQAVVLLEQGRGVLWSQLLETRTDLARLHQVKPDLASSLDAVRAELDTLHAPSTAFQAGTGGPGAGDADHAIDRRMSLARQWDSLTTQVRALPGFENFLRPTAITQLRRAAANGPIVLANVSRWRCDAIVITDTQTQVVELPHLTLDTVIERANIYLRALREFQASYHHPVTAHLILEQAITVTQEWLWDAVAEPVLTALGYHHTPRTGEPWPRLWWCPIGPLTLLPLHAAGYHHPDDEPAGRSVLDRVISSYTPTVQALINTHTGEPGSTVTTAERRLLLVALRHTPGQPELPNVDRERELLTGMFPDPGHTLLQGSAATRAAVRDKLTGHAFAHFSCHGGQDLNNPSAGGVLLHDGLLSITDLASQHHHGEFVFLSACQTALGGLKVPDEAISLAAVLQYTGWQHIIATLWTVWDTTAADITTDVYAHLAHAGEIHPTRAAEALHNAVLHERRRQHAAGRHQPSGWAPFIYAGL
jgi:hypothetical protein